MTDLSRNGIEEYISKFLNELNLIPVIGCELEFYLSDVKAIGAIKKFLDKARVKLEQELGTNQFELIFENSQALLNLLDYIEKIKEGIKAIAHKNGAIVYFDAKPFQQEPGSAFHVHINFLHTEGKNAFSKKDRYNESDYLLYSVGGLLENLENSLNVFAPNENSYERFKPSMNSPSTISWGGNNRTTAIRIPDSNTGMRRLEHRVAGADADIFAVVHTILKGMYVGITNKIVPPEKIYGNAFDEQYALKPLIRACNN